MAALGQYLTKRSNSQYYQLRRMVPAPIRSIIGKREFYRSLKVTERRAAEQLAFPLLATWEKEIADAYASLHILNDVHDDFADMTLGQIAIQTGYVDLSAFMKNKSVSFARKQAMPELNKRYKEQREIYLQDIVAEDYSRWEAITNRVLKSSDRFATCSIAERNEFTANVAKASIDALTEAIMRMEGNSHLFQPSFTNLAQLNAQKDVAANGESLLELFEKYAVQRLAERKKRCDSISQDRLVINQFADFVGQDRSVRSLTVSDVRNWRDMEAKLPKNYMKFNEFRGLKAKEIADRNLEGYKPRSNVTIQRHFSAVAGFLGWCVEQQYIERNPCSGLAWRIPKGQNSHPPFTVAQLNQILTSPLFTGFERSKREHVAGDERADDWRIWIPLVCLFTGARIGEIAQLHVDDIEVQHDIPLIQIRFDEAANKSTKSGKSRTVPIVSRLVRCGFLDFVDRQRTVSFVSGNKQLFPEIQPSARGQMSGIPSRFWRNYLSKIGIKSGNDGYGAHSFRHTMADELRLADYLNTEIEVALGHNQRTVTSGYGRLSEGTVSRLSKMFEAARFEGVCFEHLFVR